jgi:hypothetical protein
MFLKVKIFIIFLLLILLQKNEVVAQNHIIPHHSLWTRWQLNDQITNKLRWELMLQYRSQGVGENDWNMMERTQLKAYWTWLHYNFTPQFRLSFMPLCQFETYPLISSYDQNNVRPTKEFRWALRGEHQQKFKYFQMMNRAVLEYRLRNVWAEDDYVPNWRGRYMLRLSKPLKFSFLKGKSLNLIFFNEYLFQFGEAVQDFPSLFDQNRTAIGFNYQINKNIRIELAYMYVFQQRRKAHTFDLQKTLSFTLILDNIFTQWKGKKQGKQMLSSAHKNTYF